MKTECSKPDHPGYYWVMLEDYWTIAKVSSNIVWVIGDHTKYSMDDVKLWGPEIPDVYEVLDND